MGKLNEFVDLINSKIGQGYVWGGQNDDLLTKEKLDKLVNIFGREHYYFDGYSAEKWIGKEYYDCSGLIVYALRKLGLIADNADYAADGLYYSLCIPISKDDLKIGDLCFRKAGNSIVHVGMYAGNNVVTHARGTAYGVVQTELFESFNLFGRLKFFETETYQEKSWEQKLGEDAIRSLAKKGKINNPDEWLAKDLTEPTPLWLFFEMLNRI